MKLNPTRVLLFLPVFFLSSCFFFEEDENIPVTNCSFTSGPTIIGEVPATYGYVDHVFFTVNGVSQDRWVIIPTSSTNIYKPCNLPNEMKKDGQYIAFTASLVDPASLPVDTPVQGFIPIQLTSLTKKK